MPTIDQIYRDNLRLLIGEKKSQEELAVVIDKAPAQISQWLNGSKDSKTGKPRSMSRATAREIERKCGKPEGWMDRPHKEADAGELLEIFAQLSPPGRIALTQNAKNWLTAEETAQNAPTDEQRAQMQTRMDESNSPSSNRGKKPRH